MKNPHHLYFNLVHVKFDIIRNKARSPSENKALTIVKPTAVTVGSVEKHSRYCRKVGYRPNRSENQKRAFKFTVFKFTVFEIYDFLISCFQQQPAHSTAAIILLYSSKQQPAAGNAVKKEETVA